MNAKYGKATIHLAIGIGIPIFLISSGVFRAYSHPAVLALVVIAFSIGWIVSGVRALRA